MSCRLCRENKPLIKAHIIPRAIYEEVKESRDSHLVVVPTKDGANVEKSRIGFYDKTILCSDCDGRLSRFDEYGKIFIFDLEHVGTPVMSSDGRLLALQILKFDYQKLKLFFLSILWRAAVSKLESFSRVNLGPFEQSLRNYIQNEDPGAPDDFPVFLTRFTGIDLRFTMMDPVYVRMDGGIRHWILYLVACNAYIKVDRRPAITQRLALSPDQPLYVVLRDFSLSKEAEVFDAVLRRIQKM
ncbi:MAG: hypothetical protein V2A34_00220 [Lentisphaerota bacterium]